MRQASTKIRVANFLAGRDLVAEAAAPYGGLEELVNWDGSSVKLAAHIRTWLGLYGEPGWHGLLVSSGLTPPTENLPQEKFQPEALVTLLAEKCSGKFERCRDLLRDVWRDTDSTEALVELLNLRQHAEPEDLRLSALRVLPHRGSGQFRYFPRTKFEAAVYRLFTNSANLKTCKIPGCSHPYFVANPKRKKYCSVECSGIGRRKSNLASFHRNKPRKKGGKR